jgi:diguanylate cyclase
VDIIKLDKSFVDGITAAEQQVAVAAAIVQMARVLGLDAIAEGIETPAQAERLCELGYRLGQGYLFAEPLPADELGRLLAAAAGPGEAVEVGPSRAAPSARSGRPGGRRPGRPGGPR